jgi:hypothetical protein
MSFLSWLRNRKTSEPTTRNRPRGATPRPSPFRPRLEALEDRWLPSTLTVTTNLDTPFTDGSLRGEIAAAAPGDTIAFANTLNGQTINLGGEMVINKNLTIQGPGAGQLTINGGGYYASRIFEVDGAATTVTLSGLSLVDGNGMFNNYFTSASEHQTGTAPDGQGGAIWNGGTLTVSGCTLANNTADLAYDQNYSSTNAGFGGAIYNAGTLTVSNNSTLADNSAGDPYNYYYRGLGGAIYNAGTLTVSGSTLANNAAYGPPPGIYSSGGLGGAIYNGYRLTATVTGSTLTGNTATYGGALWNEGTMTVSASTLSANTASSEGGGIFNANHGKLTIQQASVVHNDTAPLGADLYNLGSVKISSSTVVAIGP